MAHRFVISMLFALTVTALVTSSFAQISNNNNGALTQPALPEPGFLPRYESPRGIPQHVVPIRPVPPPRARAAAPPPPIFVPQTGQVLPNLPTVSPSGHRGRETYQDRAARCAHQAGVYGSRAGNRGMYIGSCVNQ